MKFMKWGVEWVESQKSFKKKLAMEKKRAAKKNKPKKQSSRNKIPADILLYVAISITLLIWSFYFLFGEDKEVEAVNLDFEDYSDSWNRDSRDF